MYVWPSLPLVCEWRSGPALQHIPSLTLAYTGGPPCCFCCVCLYVISLSFTWGEDFAFATYCTIRKILAVKMASNRPLIAAQLCKNNNWSCCLPREKEMVKDDDRMVKQYTYTQNRREPLRFFLRLTVVSVQLGKLPTASILPFFFSLSSLFRSLVPCFIPRTFQWRLYCCVLFSLGILISHLTALVECGVLLCNHFYFSPFTRLCLVFILLRVFRGRLLSAHIGGFPRPGVMCVNWKKKGKKKNNKFTVCLGTCHRQLLAD